MKQTPTTSNIRLDDSVTLTLITTIVIATIALMFRYFKTPACIDFGINVNAENYYTNQNIHFSTDLPFVEKLEWSFGDGTKELAKFGKIYHSFKLPGIYNIIATHNDNCTQFVSVKISNAPVIVDTTLIPRFNWPRIAVVGIPVRFMDSSKNATEWQWRFGETTSIDATDSKPTYTFRSSGLKTISLMINNDPNRLKSVQIYVNPNLPKPQQKSTNNTNNGGGGDIIVYDRPRSRQLGVTTNNNQPTFSSNDIPPINNTNNSTQNINVSNVKKAPDITREQLESMLRQVADHSIPIQHFSKYIEDINNTPVDVNSKLTTFKEFFKELNDLKKSSKIKTLNVQMTKDAKTNAIKRLDVELKKKAGFLGL